MSATIVWFQLDLRLDDQPALGFAVAAGNAVIPVYCLDIAREGKWAPAGASKWWLHESLKSLDASLRAKGSRLILRSGDTVKELLALAKESGATSIAFNRRYEPWVREQEEALQTVAQSSDGCLNAFSLSQASIQAHSFSNCTRNSAAFWQMTIFRFYVWPNGRATINRASACCAV